MNYPNRTFYTCPSAPWGTAAGLALGLQSAGMKTIVHALSRVVTSEIADKEKCARLLTQTNRLLNELSGSFPLFDGLRNISINHDFSVRNTPFSPGRDNLR